METLDNRMMIIDNLHLTFNHFCLRSMACKCWNMCSLTVIKFVDLHVEDHDLQHP